MYPSKHEIMYSPTHRKINILPLRRRRLPPHTRRHQHNPRTRLHRLQQCINKHKICQIIILEMRLDPIDRHLPIRRHNGRIADDTVDRDGKALNCPRCLAHTRQTACVGGDEEDLGLWVLAVDVVDGGLDFDLGAAGEDDAACAAVGEGVGGCGGEFAADKACEEDLGWLVGSLCEGEGQDEVGYRFCFGFFRGTTRPLLFPLCQA